MKTKNRIPVTCPNHPQTVFFSACSCEQAEIRCKICNTKWLVNINTDDNGCIKMEYCPIGKAA